MSAYPRPVARLQRIVLATGRGPLRPVWTLVYAVVGCAAVAFFVRGERQVTIYLRNGATRREFLPGLSDLDIVIVTASLDSARRVRDHRDRFAELLPWTRPILDQPVVFSADELRDLAGVSAFTYGLDAGDPREDRAVHFGAASSPDARRMSLFPGLEPEPDGWRRIAGRERRRAQPLRDEQAERVAAWLELSNWWRIAVPICIDASAPNAAAKCVKLVADTGASWLWLEHREHVAGRGDALRRVLARAPEEEPALRRALDLQRDLTRSPAAPVGELLPAVARFSARIADLLAAAGAAAASTEVRLAGGEQAVATGARLPLCDWVALAWPVQAEEELTVVSGDLGDPAVIAAAARAYRPGSYAAVRMGQLIVLPGVGMRSTRLRAIKCPTSDPVLFALIDGAKLAPFPELRGWSALDTARRATAEHRSWLKTGRGPVAAGEVPDRPGLSFELLLTAARAALFLQSVTEGDPVLTVTTTATAAELVERGRAPGLDATELEAAHDQLRRHRRPPAPELEARLRAAVLDLPAYAPARRR